MYRNLEEGLLFAECRPNHSRQTKVMVITMMVLICVGLDVGFGILNSQNDALWTEYPNMVVVRNNITEPATPTQMCKYCVDGYAVYMYENVTCRMRMAFSEPNVQSAQDVLNTNAPIGSTGDLFIRGDDCRWEVPLGGWLIVMIVLVVLTHFGGLVYCICAS
jgi:hypothetical protein